MKKKARRDRASGSTAVPSAAKANTWWPWVAGLAALYLVFELYAPAFHGEFVFDDHSLPVDSPDVDTRPFLSWIGFNRPLSMFSFWINYRLSGVDPGAYHATNVLLHFLTSVVVT